jgi:hypothetical protein
MTNYAQHLNRPASPKQLNLLRDLASWRGVTFARPVDAAHASRQIGALLAEELPPADDLGREVQSDREEMATGHGAVAGICEEEIEGYGSEAHWK